MTTIRILPPAPNPEQPEDFDPLAGPFTEELNGWGQDVNAVRAEILAVGLAASSSKADADASAATAITAAAAAAASVGAAAAAAGAIKWVAKNYTFGDCVWSPISLLNYRRATPGITASAIDPSADSAGWRLMGTAYAMPTLEVTVATSYQLYTGIRYIVVNPLAEMLMPAGATQQESLQVTNRSGASTPILRRNGGLFDGDADDLWLGSPNFDKTFQMTTPARGWI